MKPPIGYGRQAAGYGPGARLARFTLGALTAVLVALHAARVSPQAPRPVPQAGPHRVISLVPAVTEMLFAMGAGPEVVGVSSYDHFPPEVRTRPSVGALIDPDLERILSLHPDLVVVYGTQDELISRLARLHIPTFPYELGGLADVMTTIRTLGRRIGHTAQADALAESVDRSLAAVRARVAGRPRPKTLLVIGRDEGSLSGLYASAGVGFLHDMLETAGGDDVLADVKRQSVQLSLESVLTRAPDAIVELRVEPWDAARQARELSAWRTLASLPAVRTGRLYMFTDEMMVVPGPRIAEATRILAQTLHPDAFSSGTTGATGPSNELSLANVFREITVSAGTAGSWDLSYPSYRENR